MKLTKLLLAISFLLLIPIQGLAAEYLQNCDVDDLKKALKAWKAPALQRGVDEQGIVYYAQWDGKRPISDYSVRIVADEQGHVKHFSFLCLQGEADEFSLCLEAFPDDAAAGRKQAMAWIAENLGGSLTDPSVKRTFGQVELELWPIGRVVVRPADAENQAAESTAPAKGMSFDHKPGIKGSNAYDLTIGAKDNGMTVGKRLQTSDGYSWMIDGLSAYGTYTITIEANKQYEIHRAVFAHAGKDATFFPWAVALPFESADIDGATAWVKACQKAGRADTFTAGDAVWTYKPHENGKRGGVLTLTVDSFDAYGLYLLEQLE